MVSAEDLYAEEERQLEPAFVTYLAQVGAEVVVVENVPARVHKLTGERLFSTETTDRLLQIMHGQVAPPVRLAETRVYLFAA